jgi:hypothetical protein
MPRSMNPASWVISVVASAAYKAFIALTNEGVWAPGPCGVLVPTPHSSFAVWVGVGTVGVGVRTVGLQSTGVKSVCVTYALVYHRTQRRRAAPAEFGGAFRESCAQAHGMCCLLPRWVLPASSMEDRGEGRARSWSYP